MYFVEGDDSKPVRQIDHPPGTEKGAKPQKEHVNFPRSHKE